MSRTTHDRQLDHHNQDLAGNVDLDSSTTTYSAGDDLMTVVADLDDRVGTGGFSVVLGGGGSVIGTGIAAELELPFAGAITAARLLADQTGSIVIDVKKATYSGLPSFSSIAASAKPTLASARKSEDTTLTGWTTTFAAGDWLQLNVDSATTVTRVTLALRVRRT